MVFLGGCTFSEISALRWLQSRPGSAVRFIVLTSKIINGTSLVETFVDAQARAYSLCFGSGGAGGKAGVR